MKTPNHMDKLAAARTIKLAARSEDEDGPERMNTNWAAGWGALSPVAAGMHRGVNSGSVWQGIKHALGSGAGAVAGGVGGGVLGGLAGAGLGAGAGALAKLLGSDVDPRMLAALGAPLGAGIGSAVGVPTGGAMASKSLAKGYNRRLREDEEKEASHRDKQAAARHTTG